jgi:hypothetical protein
MCWSSSASIAATAIGTAATVYSIKKDAPKVQTLTLAFFTLMELLQALSYMWIDQCAMGGNILLTRLSYLHIAFQPPVINAFILSFVSEKTRKKWFKPVMVISFICTFIIVANLLLPMVWAVPKELMCKIGESLCGTDTCSYQGNWHLAWRLPLLGAFPGYLLYFIPVFVLPIVYGHWRASLYHFLLGPLPAFLSTRDLNEVPAIWCLFSIAVLSAVFIKPLKKLIFPKR